MTGELVDALRTHRPSLRRGLLGCMCGHRWYWWHRFGCTVYRDLLTELARCGPAGDGGIGL